MFEKLFSVFNDACDNLRIKLNKLIQFIEFMLLEIMIFCIEDLCNFR